MEWILLFPLIPMIFQDFRCRRVSLVPILLFGVLQICVCIWKYGAVQAGYNILANLIALIIISGFVTIYAYFRFKLKKQIIGGGDIIFLLLLTPYFTFPYLLHFLIVSFLLALFGWGIRIYHTKEKVFTIPLISYLGICYAIIIMYNSLFYLWK